LTPFLAADLKELPGPKGCTNVDLKIVDAAGLRVAGLGGSIRYSDGPNQYTQAGMRRRALRLRWRLAALQMRSPGSVDVVVTHAPPSGLGDGKDPAHRGFESLHTLMRKWGPKILVHGHVHPYGQLHDDRLAGATTVVNAVAYRMLEVEP
jgi:Icc-related predicted phosphoesterase